MDFLFIIFINFTEAYFIILVEFFNQIYVFIIIIYGIETSSPRRTYIQALSDCRKTRSSNKHEREASIYFHYSLHLSSMLSNTTLRSTSCSRQRPFHVDESHLSFKSRDPNGARFITSHFCRMDSSIIDWYWHHCC